MLTAGFVGRLLESVDNREEFTVAPISSTASEYGGNIKRDEVRLKEKGATRHGTEAAFRAFRFIGHVSRSPGFMEFP